MSKKLAPYGSFEQSDNLAKVGKSKSSASLAGRMPSPDIVAKVGAKGIAPRRLGARMPSAQIAAKVGMERAGIARTRRVVRRNARV